MSERPSSDKVRRQLIVWTVICGALGVALLVIAGSSAEVAFTVICAVGGALGIVLAGVFWLMRVRLGYLRDHTD